MKVTHAEIERHKPNTAFTIVQLVMSQRPLFKKVASTCPTLKIFWPEKWGCKSDEQHIRSFEQNRVFGAKL